MKKRKFPQDVARFFHPEKSMPLTGNKGTHRVESSIGTQHVIACNGPSQRRYNRMANK